jgi:ABC-type antimicrobial peptide transport system permease subunit
MESLLVQLPALLKLCVAALIFAIGLGSSLGDLTYLGRRPGLLLRSLLVSIAYLAWRRRGEVATGDAQRGK